MPQTTVVGRRTSLDVGSATPPVLAFTVLYLLIFPAVKFTIEASEHILKRFITFVRNIW